MWTLPCNQYVEVIQNDRSQNMSTAIVVAADKGMSYLEGQVVYVQPCAVGAAVPGQGAAAQMADARTACARQAVSEHKPFSVA